MAETRKNCAFCAEPINANAIVCRHCGRDMSGKLRRKLPEQKGYTDAQKRRRWVFAALTVAAFSGAFYWRSGQDVRDAMETVRGQLKDPDSAKFTNVRKSRDGSHVCGYVNAKNSMGGYVGNQPFISAAPFSAAELRPDEKAFGSSADVAYANLKRATFEERFKKVCGG
jgi:hypothetical protein